MEIRAHLLKVSACMCMFLLGIQLAWGSVGGSISGLVSDASGAVIAGAEVTALNTATGIKEMAKTDTAGFYSFPTLPIGPYEIQVRQAGFKEFRTTGLVIDANTALRVDATLQVGAVTQEVSVSATAVQVDTTSTQNGQVIGATAMEIVPLNGRSFVDLMALQPGVVPQTSGMYGTTISGELDSGNFSVSGARESANGFMLNGGNVQEGNSMGTEIIPNLDSIAEFRIITNDADAEYGNYAGGLVNAITKSGTNQFHGDVFEFIRNYDLDARNFFSTGRPLLRKNEFGGTLGGPIRHDKLFFFADYQGNRQTVGTETGEVLVPSNQDLTGNLSDVASSFYSVDPETQQIIPNTVVGQNFANTLTQKLGYPVTVGEAYYVPNCTSSANCVFPNAVIPQSAWAAPAAPLIKYIPQQNHPGYFETASSPDTLQDDKASGRLDANTRFGLVSGYYFIDEYAVINPYPHANVPGFSASNAGRAQNINFAVTKNFGPSSVNEFRLNYSRFAAASDIPLQGTGVSLSSLGFVEGQGTLGIYPITPAQYAGVPTIYFNNFTIGIPSISYNYNNTYQVLDNFSKIIGTHSLKFGGEWHYDWITHKSFGEQMGEFTFNGTETGSDFADFLIGAPASYDQGQQLPFHTRTKYYGAYVQDSWRARKDLTLNLGLRWESSSPFYEAFNQMEALNLGETSVVFPGSPTGWVFPGDPGIPTTIAPTRWNNFAPRIGIAYAPHADSGFWGKVLGGAGKTSIRAAFGIYYTAFEDAALENAEGDAPFGYFWSSVAPPEFATPFVDRQTGFVEGQKFPAPFPPTRPVPSAKNPDTNVDWPSFLPISSSPVLGRNDTLPYSEAYNLTIQRELSPNTILSVGYVGTQGHRLISPVESNIGNPTLCMSLSQPSDVISGGAVCGPNGENTVYTTAAGQVVNGTRGPFGNAFGSNDYFNTMGNSNYNSLQTSLRHSSRRSQILVAYTYSKVLANASSWGSGSEVVNPLNYKLSKALASFDSTNNFVASYNYEIPFEKLWRANRLTRGWVVSGITHFSTGLPILLRETDDHSLLGTGGGGPGSNGADEPNFVPGNLAGHNPRTAVASQKLNPEFNTALFQYEGGCKTCYGVLGTANRRFFHGNGLNNWDMSLQKNIRLTESKRLEIRAELFNIWNHAQFANESGNFLSSSFGFATSANSPRIGELAAKFYF